MVFIEGRTGRSGWRVAVVGTGGQGVLTGARLLSDAFVDAGHHVVSGQLHGMAQRGGSVQASVCIDSGISPVIAHGGADYVLGLEPGETARSIPLMSPRTLVYMNTAPVIPCIFGQRSVVGEEHTPYPDTELLKNSIHAVTSSLYAFDATRLALEAGSVKTLNIVMLGCLLASASLPCAADDFRDTLERRMPARLRETNAMAFSRGVELGKKLNVAEGTE